MNNRNSIRRSALSLTIAVLIAANTSAAANEGDDCQPNDPRRHCHVSESRDGSNKWLLGGLAVVGVALAAGGGGSGSDSGGGGGPLPGGGQGGREGGSYGHGSTLIAAGGHANWGQNLSTQVVGNNVRNDGTLAIQAGTLTLRGEGDLRNNGTITTAAGTLLSIEGEGELNNYGTLGLDGRVSMSGDGSLDNYGALTANNTTFTLSGESDIENTGTMRLTNTTVALAGDSDFDNANSRTSRGQLHLDGSTFTLRDMAEFENSGDIHAANLRAGSTLFDIHTQRLHGNERIEAFENHGTIRLDSDASVLSLVANTHESVGINRASGQIVSHARNAAMLDVAGQHATFVNQGTLTVTGSGAVAMNGRQGATLINDGTINLGTQGGANGTGLVAMQSDGSAILNNRVNGIINIYANDSHAFKVTGSGTGRIINNGRVNVYGAGSGIHADDETAAADRPGPDLPYVAPRSQIAGYTIGTNADGSAGQMVLAEDGQIVDVDVDTGFTRGTSDQTVRLEDVFVGANGGENNIRSQNVVWNAQAQRDESGNVDVTMTRNAYADLVGDGLHDLAQALDNGYTNSEVFHSLELASIGALEQAMSQLSGQGLAAGMQRAASGGQAFWAALDAQRPIQGLSIVGFTPGLRQGWGPQGQGSAMTLVMPTHNGLASTDVQMGILHTSHTGSAHAADDSMQSNYFGLGWTRNLGAFELRHGLSNEWHALNTRRSLAYGDVRRQARSERSIARNVLSSTLSRDWNVGSLQFQPRVAASAYRHNEGAFKEAGAGDFNLNVGAVTAFGMNLETGMGWQRAFGSRWRMSGDAALIKAVAHDTSDRRVTLSGAAPVEFQLRGLRPNGLDHRFNLGLDYVRGATRMNLSAQSQQLLGERDARLDMNLAYWF